jgi:hypothetical protein
MFFVQDNLLDLHLNVSLAQEHHDAASTQLVLVQLRHSHAVMNKSSGIIIMLLRHTHTHKHTHTHTHTHTQYTHTHTHSGGRLRPEPRVS